MFSAARAEKFNFSLLRGLRGSHFLHTAQAVRLTFFSTARACEAIVSGSHFLISLLTSAARACDGGSHFSSPPCAGSGLQGSKFEISPLCPYGSAG